MNAREVADALGMNERSVRRAVAAGRLPASRNGRCLDIDLEVARSVMQPQPGTGAVYREALADALHTLRSLDYVGQAEKIERRYGLVFDEPRPMVTLSTSRNPDPLLRDNWRPAERPPICECRPDESYCGAWDCRHKLPAAPPEAKG